VWIRPDIRANVLKSNSVLQIHPGVADTKGNIVSYMTHTVSDALKEQVLRLAQKLPTSPHIFGKLGSLLNDINTDLEEIVKLVSVDPGLTARVIRLSNSVFFRGDEPVRTLDEAINRVGFREMHKIVGVAMTEQIFQSGLPVYNLTASEVWENSVVTALAMERLARFVSEDQGVAYTVGLLRPVGKLVLDMKIEVEHPGITCPESETLELPKWERAWAEITSNEAGALILEHWKMPQAVFEGVLHHYRPESGCRMGALLHVACWMTTELGRGMKAEAKQWAISDELLGIAGISNANLQECLTETQEAIAELKTRLKAA
jgi:HD-like signal output (HDOD) protein